MLTLFLEVEETRTDTDDDGGIGCREERFDRGRSRRPQSRGRGEVYFAVARGAATRGSRGRNALSSHPASDRRSEVGDRIGMDPIGVTTSARPGQGAQGPGPRGQGPREGTQRDCTIQQSTCDNNNNSNHHKNIVIQG